MSVQIVNWGKLPVKFLTEQFKKQDVEAAISYAEKAVPNATADVPGDIFMGLATQNGVKVARFGTPKCSEVVFNDTVKGTLDDLFAKVAKRLEELFSSGAKAA